MRGVYLEAVNSRIREFNLVRNYCIDNKLPYEIITTKDIQRNRLQLRADWIFDGTVEFIHTVLTYFNKPFPVVDTYPEILHPYLLRKVRKITLGQLPEDFQGFIKPAVEVKKFTGFVANDYSEIISKTSHCSKNTEVYLSDFVKFISETRYYVLNGRVISVGHYDGDVEKCPNQIVVREAIDKLQTTNPPSAYCIDFGLLDDGRTALVEYNDCYAVGWYIDPVVDIVFGDDRDEKIEVYLRLISTRFAELME